MEKNIDAGNYLNHLYLMSGLGGDGTNNWLDGFILASNNHSIIQVGEVLGKFGINGLSKKIEVCIVEKNISLLLIESSTPILDPFFIQYLKNKYSLLVVTYAIDDEFKFEWISSIYATISDIVLTLDYVSLERYRQAGINAFFFMHSIKNHNQNFEKNIDDLEHYVSFVGKVDGKPSREGLIKYLAQRGIETKVFASNGPGDPSFLPVNEMNGVFNKSLINLSFSGISTYVKSFNVLNDRIRGNKARPFEIALAKGFCLCEFSISTSKWLENEKEIVFFHTYEDLVNKINYYIDNPDETQKIAQAAYLKVIKEFSSKAIAEKFLSHIDASKDNFGKDLYGHDQKLKISKWFAHSFIEFTFPKSISLIFKGKLNLFFYDFLYLVKFITQLFSNIGIMQTFQILMISFYRMLKTLISKAKYW